MGVSVFAQGTGYMGEPFNGFHDALPMSGAQEKRLLERFSG